ncbi:hypothetical protein [Streptomyces olivaceoviridis]|uniref:hypothetical protein n=1 Tax=Streptomyces olivaceoviridis TaxID=1921 RepID=UPI003701B50B
MAGFPGRDRLQAVGLGAAGDMAGDAVQGASGGVGGSGPGHRLVRGGPGGAALPDRGRPARDAGGAAPGRGRPPGGTVRAELPAVLAGTPHPYVRLACDTATTRTPAAHVRRDLGVPKHRVHALGCRRAE